MSRGYNEAPASETVALQDNDWVRGLSKKEDRNIRKKARPEQMNAAQRYGHKRFRDGRTLRSKGRAGWQRLDRS